MWPSRHEAAAFRCYQINGKYCMSKRGLSVFKFQNILISMPLSTIQVYNPERCHVCPKHTIYIMYVRKELRLYFLRLYRFDLVLCGMNEKASAVFISHSLHAPSALSF